MGLAHRLDPSEDSMIAALMLANLAFSQDAPEAAPPEEIADDVRAEMGVNIRYRRMWLFDAFIDPWYFDTEDYDGVGALDEAYKRPSISANTFGLEFTLTPQPANFVVYAEYMAFSMPPGYWDDRESPEDHLDGDWVETSGLGMIALGANFGHEFAITDDSAETWFGLVVGGGLGLGVVTGEMQRWHPGRPSPTSTTTASACPWPQDALKRAANPTPRASSPRCFRCSTSPSVRVFHIAEVMTVRIDVGFHDLPYVGGAAGAVF